MHPTTQILHPAQAPSNDYRALNGGLYRASTVLFPTAQAFAARHAEPKPDYVYGTQGTPTVRALELAMAASEGAAGCVLASSGLGALAMVNLALLTSGDHVLIGDNGYEPNRNMLASHLAGYGITYSNFNPLDITSLNAAMTKNTRLVWCEPVGSNTQEVCDLPAIAAAVHSHGAWLAVDHTWSAGIALNVFAQGVDVAIQAMTKYQCGSGDVCMGSVTWAGTAQGLAIAAKIKHTQEVLGYSVSPDDCALVLRGMQTMHLRYHAQGAAAAALAQWLATRPEVGDVLHPALPSAAGHAVWQRDYTGSASLFSFTLAPRFDQAACYRFVNALKLFGIGASWGAAHSLVLAQVIHRHAMPRPAGQLVRLQIGLEHVDDLRADLAAGFAALSV
jgi:cysteine-S-conjugate beta-lyase